MNYLCFKPGILEVICGPMKSGKSDALISRIAMIPYTEHGLLLIKPRVDTRNPGINSRLESRERECLSVDEQNPKEILNIVKPNHDIIAIDEAQFFGKEIIEVVLTLLSMNKNVIVSGLDLDFRGEPFGQMHNLMAIANEVTKLSAVCEFGKCDKPATRTQRLINGEPAPYDSPTILVGDKKEGYESRCLKHHTVAGKSKVI